MQETILVLFGFSTATSQSEYFGLVLHIVGRKKYCKDFHTDYFLDSIKNPL